MHKIFILLAALPGFVQAAPLQINVTDIAGKPVGNVVVYLQNHVTAAMPQTHHNHDIAQQDKKFAPYVSVVRQHEQVAFINHDDITHHLYSFNGPARFDFRLKAAESKSVGDFTEPGIIAMGCNIHDWMSGYVMVVATPFYTVTNTEGLALFTDVPAGEYHLVVWHPQMAEDELTDLSVVVPGMGTTNVRLTKPLAPIPSQTSLDDFDFLEAY